MEQLTSEQRKKTYLKLGKSFEEGNQQCGLCMAFGDEFPDLDAYDTPILLFNFPELDLLWANKVIPFKRKDEAGYSETQESGDSWYGGFPRRDEEGQNIRAMILYFAAAICE